MKFVLIVVAMILNMVSMGFVIANCVGTHRKSKEIRDGET